jgi:hypothetical protein
LALNSVRQIGKKFIDGDQRSVHTFPDDFSVLIDQEVEPFRELPDIIVSAELLDDDGIDVAQKCIFRVDLFLENALRRAQIA